MHDGGYSDDVEPIDLHWRTVSTMEPAESVARALCEHDGRRPDDVIRTGRAAPAMSADGVVELALILAPAWTTYLGEARRFIAAFEALTGASSAGACPRSLGGAFR